MSDYSIEVHVTPRSGILDPQGKAVHSALHTLAFPEVGDVRVGRLICLQVNASTKEDARDRVEAMCKQLLANPVTEDYMITFADDGSPAA